MKRFKKGLRVLPKKIFSLFLAIATLFTNLMPLRTVFAITEEEKADLVQLNMRRSNNIQINDNQANITYGGGTVTVTGASLTYECDPDYNYGNGDVSNICYLYTTSNALTFHTYPAEDHTAGYWYDGLPQDVTNNEYAITNLQTYGQKHDGYDIEFFFKNNQPYSPPPADETYMVDFENNSWFVRDSIVSASIEDKVLDDGLVEVMANEIIHLNNYNRDNMQVIISSEGGFSSQLYVDDEFNTCIAWLPHDVSLPPAENLTFRVEEFDNNQNSQFIHIEFGNATWEFEEETVTASIENMTLTTGPVDIDETVTIHLEGFDYETMHVFLNGDDSFRIELEVDENNNTNIGMIQGDGHLPGGGTLYFNIQKDGSEPPIPWEEPTNPEQDGEIEAIIRVKGVDGTYDEWGEEKPYNGAGAVCNETRFNINGGAVFRALRPGEVIEDEEFKYNETIYNYDEEDGDETIDLGLYTPWNLKFSDTILINDVPYQVSDYIDYDDRDSWLTHVYGNDNIGFTITVPKANDNVYNIVVKIDFSEHEFMNRYRWTNNEEAKYYRDEETGEIIYEDEEPLMNEEYIGNATIEIVNVTFVINDVEYNYTEDNFGDGAFYGDFIEYHTYHNKTIDEGELIFPADSVFTIRIVPKYGYQISYVGAPSPDIFTIGENPGEFTIFTEYMLRGTDFSFSIEKSENEVNIDSKDVVEASIIIPNNALNGGGVTNFYISDVEPTEELLTKFTNFNNEYQLTKFLNIGLEQIISKGNGEDFWITEIHHLDRKATITIKLKDGIDADKIVIIHNIDDGEDFEIINIDSYDKETNTITFKTNSFSNFAVATMNYTEITSINVNLDQPVAGEKVNVSNNGVENVPDLTPKANTDVNDPYTIEKTLWVNGICGLETNKCNELFNGTFQAGEDDYFYALITIFSRKGYKLTENSLTNVNVNGRTLSSEDGDEFFEIEGSGDNTSTKFIVKIKAQPAPISIIKGDMDGNGIINLQDIIYLLKMYLGVISPTLEESSIGDIDDDDNLTLKDVILLLKNYLGVN